MKRITTIILSALFLLQLSGRAQTAATGDIFPSGKKITANFTGTVWVQPLVPKDSIFNLVAGSVTFEPGARSYWHTHNAGQILLVTNGTGYTQEKGKPIRVIHKGDIIICPPNVEHWHGASPGSSMTHISLNPNADKGVVTWLRPVTDEEYTPACCTTGINTQTIMSNQQHADSKLPAIVSISALTAAGDIEQLKIQLNKGLDAGLTINEIKEILVQLYAYCGFPRSLNGIITLMAVIEERKAKGIQDKEGAPASPVNDTDKYQTGKKTLQTLTGIEEKAPAGANAFAPAIDTFLKEHLFADIFSRDALTWQQRELVTVSALAGMNGVVPQLQAHLFIAMNTGITPSQLSEAFAVIDQTIGKSQGDTARATLDKVLAGKKQ